MLNNATCRSNFQKSAVKNIMENRDEIPRKKKVIVKTKKYTHNFFKQSLFLKWYHKEILIITFITHLSLKPKTAQKNYKC